MDKKCENCGKTMVYNKSGNYWSHTCSNFEGPTPGSLAYTANFLSETGLITGEEADAWKEQMKEKF